MTQGSQILESCFSSGQCRDSYNLETSRSADEFSCLATCQADPECQWFTFATSLSLCLTFKDCQVLDDEFCPDCLSGQRGCDPGEPVCMVDGGCEGVLDHFESLPTVNDCLQLCNSTLGCRWFTYMGDLSSCLMYKNCPGIDPTCENCISGERRCVDGASTTSTSTATEASTTSAPAPKRESSFWWLGLKAVQIFFSLLHFVGDISNEVQFVGHQTCS